MSAEYSSAHQYDRLGPPVCVTDANGDVVVNYHNTVFGTTWAYNAAGYNQGTTDVQPYHLTTKEWDADTGYQGRFL